ncbi:MAG: hypothetical protein L3K19_07270 [Thermoplasmata archaeon]|nr:hypothetical protein [Thermoplasmata archaeon]
MGDEAAPLLRRLLEAAGYRLEDRPGGLRGIRARDHRAVFVVDGLRSPVELEHEFPADSVRRTLVFPEDPGAVARGFAAERGIEVLDPATLGPGLGELLLSPAPDTTGGSTESTRGLSPPAAVFPDGERTIRPRLGPADARRLAGVDGPRTVLRWVPYYVLAYRVRPASAHGGTGRASDHLAAVNALSGHVEFWEPGERELVSDVEFIEHRMSPQLDSAEALALAGPAVRRIHTISVDHMEQHGGALVIERRKVPPGPEDLAFGPPVLVHVPYWYIEGREGRAVIDAVSGETAMPEEAELPLER